MGYETKPGVMPDVLDFSDISHGDLVVRFFESRTDPVIGRELSVRLLTHAGFLGDPTVEPLIGRAGTQLVDEATGSPLTLADYVTYATQHHRHALQPILGFLFTAPGEPAYAAGQAAYAQYINSDAARA